MESKPQTRVWYRLNRFKAARRRRHRLHASTAAHAPPGALCAVETLESRALLSSVSLDPTFGADGKVTTDLQGPSYETGQDIVAWQSNGKMVVAGFYSSESFQRGLGVVRYDIDGSLDASFGNNGQVIVELTSPLDTDGISVAVDSHDRIILGSTTSSSSTSWDFTIVRLKADGTLDVDDNITGHTGFSADGRQTVDFGNSVDFLEGIAVDAYDRILATGRSMRYTSNTGWDFATARLNVDGTLDADDSATGYIGFGGDGRQTLDFGSPSDYGEAVALDSQGRIIVAGSSYRSGSDWDFVVARLNPDGTLDADDVGYTGFAGDGWQLIDFARNTDWASDVAVDAHDRIVVCGTRWVSGTGFRFAVARLQTNGALDRDDSSTGYVGFSTDGLQTISFGPHDYCTGMAIDSRGRIVLAGRVLGDFAIARLRQDGALDADDLATGYVGFSSDGKQTIDFGARYEFGEAVAVDGNDRIVVAGTVVTPSSTDFGLTRLSPNGTLDTSFGSEGRVLTDLRGSTEDSASDVIAFQSDGKMLVAGAAAHGFNVVRYNVDGSLDTAFGSSGSVNINIGDNSAGNAVALAVDSRDRIIVSGSTVQVGTHWDFAVTRLKPDGMLDADDSEVGYIGFGGDGRQTIDFGNSTDQAFGVAIDSYDRILVAGYSHSSWTAPSYDFAVARLRVDGTLDRDDSRTGYIGFSEDGRQTVDLGDTADYGRAIAVDSQGRIVIAGYSSETRGDNDFAVVRLKPDGTLDTDDDASGYVGFSGNGWQKIDFGGAHDYGWDLVLDSHERVLIAGYSYEVGIGYAASVARLQADGALDADDSASGYVGFATDGRQNVDFGSVDSWAEGVTVDSRDRVVLVGGAYQDATGYDFSVARLTEDGVPDSQFDDDGVATIDFDSPEDWASSVIVDSRGRIVVAGTTDGGQTGYDFAVLRLQPTAPEVQSVEIGGNVQSFVVQLNDDDLNPSQATDASNYQILAANGDSNGDGDLFNDGDETPLAIDHVDYDPSTDQITIHTLDILFADHFQLILDGDDATSDGADGLSNAFGIHLEGGDYVAEFDLTVLQLVNDLLSKVEDLGLSTGSESSLTSKLDAVLNQLDQNAGNDESLTAKLEAFMRGVESWYAREEITLAEHEELIEDAEFIILGLLLTE